MTESTPRWVKVGQAVTPTESSVWWEHFPSEGVGPRYGEVCVVEALVTTPVITGDDVVGLVLAELKTKFAYHWSGFRPVYPQAVEELMRLPSPQLEDA